MTEKWRPYEDSTISSSSGTTMSSLGNIELQVALDENFRPVWEKGAFQGCEFIVPLMQLCWGKKPERRPDFETILRQLDSGGSGSGISVSEGLTVRYSSSSEEEEEEGLLPKGRSVDTWALFWEFFEGRVYHVVRRMGHEEVEKLWLERDGFWCGDSTKKVLYSQVLELKTKNHQKEIGKVEVIVEWELLGEEKQVVLHTFIVDSAKANRLCKEFVLLMKMALK